MKSLLTVFSGIVPRLLETEAADTTGNSTIKLIIMGALLVAFIVIFILVSKKMKKTK